MDNDNYVYYGTLCHSGESEDFIALNYSLEGAKNTCEEWMGDIPFYEKFSIEWKQISDVLWIAELDNNTLLDITKIEIDP
jgi:hypothetical protein